MEGDMLARMSVPKFGQKWFLIFDFGYLWAISRVAVGSGFFAVSALLIPAQVFEPAKR